MSPQPKTHCKWLVPCHSQKHIKANVLKIWQNLILMIKYDILWYNLMKKCSSFFYIPLYGQKSKKSIKKINKIFLNIFLKIFKKSESDIFWNNWNWFIKMIILTPWHTQSNVWFGISGWKNLKRRKKVKKVFLKFVLKIFSKS